jgi:hypothetical protein
VAGIGIAANAIAGCATVVVEVRRGEKRGKPR